MKLSIFYLTFTLFWGPSSYSCNAVFPYVTAGDTKTIHPESGLHSIEPERLDSDANLVKELLAESYQASNRSEEDVQEEEGNNQLNSQTSLPNMNVRIPGDLLTPYTVASDSTNDISSIAPHQNIEERFGTSVSFFMGFFNSIVLVPFLWFSFSGSSQNLYKVFVSCAAASGVHTFFLTWLLNQGYSGSLSIILSLCLAAGVAIGLSFNTYVLWLVVVTFNYIILLAHLRYLAFIGPYGFTGWIPFVSTSCGFYLCLFILASFLTGISTMMKEKTVSWTKISNAVYVATVSSFIVTSALAGLAEQFFHVVSDYNYIAFFSVPGPYLQHSYNLVFLMTFILLTVMGTVVNYIRYCQFGIKTLSEGEAASFLLSDKEDIAL